MRVFLKKAEKKGTGVSVKECRKPKAIKMSVENSPLNQEQKNKSAHGVGLRSWRIWRKRGETKKRSRPVSLA